MSLSSGARHALAEASVWVISALAMVGGIVYFDDLRGLVGLQTPAMHAVSAPLHTSRRSQVAQQQPSLRSAPGSVELSAGPNGHFFADAEINGSRIPVMVDTGASLVALSHEAARRAGVYVQDSDFKYKVSTANGPARIAVVKLDRVSIGDITVYDVRAAVSERGALGTTLLGMSFLGKLKRAEMRGGRLILEN